MTITPGTRLGRYEIRSKIGEGGMGEVYLARDEKLNRDVAIKVLPATYSQDADRLRRFEQEAQAASSLNHPNILSVFDFGEYDGAPYVVSELLEGESLKDRLSDGPIAQRKAIDYAVHIARGLAAAHEKGIVHRDVKPDNLFITNDDRVKILDFGIAKLIAPPTEGIAQTDVATRKVRTDPGTVIGTVGYMSPEQVRGRGVDHRSDIFSFGAVLYEMLSGRRAFRGESPVETLNAILKDEPVELTNTNRNIAPSLERVVWHCLEKSPERRFQSANDAAFALESISGVSSASAQTAFVSTSRPGKNRERLIWLAAVALVAIIAIAFAVIALRRPAPTANVVRFPVRLPEKTAFYVDSESHNVSVSPDGNRIAFIAMNEGQKKLYLHDLDKLDAQPLPDTKEAYSPFWSPDSRAIAFFAEGKLKKIEVGGGSVQTICDAPVRNRGGSWGRDGTIIFSNSEGLFRVNSTGGAPAPLLSSRKIHGDWVAFLPDGRHFLFDVRTHYEASDKKETTGEGIYVGSLESEEPQLLFPSANTRVEYAPPGYLLFVREGALLAQAFDAASLRLSGEPVVVLDHMTYFDKTGWAEFSASQNGVLVYMNNLWMTRLAWFDRTGRELGQVGAPAMYGNPRLSPDGKRLAASIGDPRTASGDIQIFDLARDTPTRFAFGPTDDENAVWAPDGQSLAYFSCCDRDKSSLRIKGIGDPAGSGQAPLASGFAIPCDWSPDGRFLIYAVLDKTWKGDLWVLPLAGDQKPFVFLATPFDEWDANFSPDGHFVAYVSDHSGLDEVYVRRFPESNEEWRISNAGGGYPRWARSGKEIFYVAANGKLMSAGVNAGETFSAAAPTPLFPLDMIWGGGYTPAPDGQRFLVNTPVTGEQSTPFTVVLNWSSGLKR